MAARHEGSVIVLAKDYLPPRPPDAVLAQTEVQVPHEITAEMLDIAISEPHGSIRLESLGNVVLVYREFALHTLQEQMYLWVAYYARNRQVLGYRWIRSDDPYANYRLSQLFARLKRMVFRVGGAGHAKETGQRSG